MAARACHFRSTCDLEPSYRHSPPKFLRIMEVGSSDIRPLFECTKPTDDTTWWHADSSAHSTAQTSFEQPQQATEGERNDHLPSQHHRIVGSNSSTASAYRPTQFRRVCRHWRDVVQESTLLQRNLFLRMHGTDTLSLHATFRSLSISPYHRFSVTTTC